MKRIVAMLSVLLLGMTVTACAPAEPAAAPSVAEHDRAAVQEKLQSTSSQTEEAVTGSSEQNLAASRELPSSEQISTESPASETAVSDSTAVPVTASDEPDTTVQPPAEPEPQAPAETPESSTAIPDETQPVPQEHGTNILVAYFSRADENYNVGTIDIGNTQIVAEYIASEVGADSFHIETVTPYPADYKACCDVAK